LYDGLGQRYWLGALDSPDEELRHKAIFALGVIGSENPEVVPALAKILADDPDVEARHVAALALLKVGPAARAAVSELAEALADEHPSVRMNAALVLLQLGPQARQAVPALIAAVEFKRNRTNLGLFNSTIQEVAARALGAASAGSSVGVAVLTNGLKAAYSTESRMAFASALGKVGPPARPAVPQLRALLSDKAQEVREAAEAALKNIGS
jgi:HEAT repeat protein